MSNDDNVWKDKYHDILKELDRHDKDKQAYEQLLYRCINKLTILVQGIEPALDEQLEQLKKLLAEKEHQEAVTLLLESLNDNFRRAEVITIEKLNDFKKTLLEIFEVISYMALPHDLLSEQRALYKRLKKFQHLEEQQDLVKSISTFVQAILVSLRNNEVVLFPPKSSISVLKDLITGPRIDESQNLSLPDAIQENIAKVIDYLGVSTQQAESAKVLYAEIELGLKYRNLVSFMERLASLVVDVAQEDEQRMETFCSSLKTQMSDSKSFFSNLSGVINKQTNQAEQLYQDIDNKIQAINTQLLTDNSQNEKINMSNRLDEILHLVSNYRGNADNTLQDALKNIAQLNLKLAKAEQQISAMNQYVADKRYGMQKDSLTSLPNRQAYIDWLDNEILRAHRHNHATCYAIADIDHFKKINDQYGHDVGDRALVACARLMKETLRNTDYIARFGGEEFVIVLVETKLEDAENVIENLRTTIEKAPFTVQDKNISITVSFGLTDLRLGDDRDSVFKRADAALYQAKDQGRNQVRLG